MSDKNSTSKRGLLNMKDVLLNVKDAKSSKGSASSANPQPGDSASPSIESQRLGKNEPLTLRAATLLGDTLDTLDRRRTDSGPFAISFLSKGKAGS